MPIANLRSIAALRSPPILPDEIGEGNDCVLLLPLNEGAGNPLDYSGYGNNGTLSKTNGVLPAWVTGRYGSALEFDGVGSYLDCGAGVSLDVVTFIIEAWIKAANPDIMNLIASKRTGITGWDFEFRGDANHQLVLFVGNGTSWRNLNSDNNVITDTEWHHVVAVYEQATRTVTFYVDGAAAGSAVGTFDLVAAAGTSLFIGLYSGDYMNGIVDSVGLYRKLFNANQAKARSLGARILQQRSLAVVR